MGNLDAKPVEENYSIDIIRFIAIFMVILLHCTGFPYHFTNTSITNMDIVNWFSTNAYAAVGMFGVPLFVMLTGALLLNPNHEDEPLKIFYKKRLDRIALPFIFWTVIYFAWTFTILGKRLTLLTIMQGLSSGAFAHLWYLYLLMGLYAITPILRVLVKHLDRKLFAYLLVLWFAGTTLTPAVHAFLPELNYHPYTFILLDWVGYFLLGTYLLGANMRRSRVYLIVLLGLVGTIVGDWLLTGTMGEQYTGFFHSYVSPTVILGSAALFLALIALDLNRLRKYKVSNRVIHWVSQNTLPIYLIHMIVIVTLISTSVFGIWLNSLTHTPLIDTPAFAVVVFAVSSAIVFILKKIPYIKKLVG